MDGLKLIHIILVAGLVAHAARYNVTQQPTFSTNSTQCSTQASQNSSVMRPASNLPTTSGTFTSVPTTKAIRCLLPDKDGLLTVIIVGVLVVACMALLLSTVILACQVCYLQQQQRYFQCTRTNVDVICAREAAADGCCLEAGVMLEELEMQDNRQEPTAAAEINSGTERKLKSSNIQQEGGAKESETVPVLAVTEPPAPPAEESLNNPAADMVDCVIEV